MGCVVSARDWLEPLEASIPIIVAVVVLAGLWVAVALALGREASGHSCAPSATLLNENAYAYCDPGESLTVTDAGDGRWIATCSCPTPTP